MTYVLDLIRDENKANYWLIKYSSVIAQLNPRSKWGCHSAHVHIVADFNYTHAHITINASKSGRFPIKHECDEVGKLSYSRIPTLLLMQNEIFCYAFRLKPLEWFWTTLIHINLANKNEANIYFILSRLFEIYVSKLQLHEHRLTLFFMVYPKASLLEQSTKTIKEKCTYKFSITT